MAKDKKIKENRRRNRIEKVDHDEERSSRKGKGGLRS